MQRIGLLTAAFGAVAVVACGGTAAPVTTAAPQANADSSARERAQQDSIARVDEERRAREEADRMAERHRADSLAALQRTATEVRTELATMIHFAFDRANIRPGDAAALDRKIPLLQVNSGLRLRIAGHCDERGSDEYNLALGNRRALSAKQYLTSHGIAAERIEIVSYGKERPLDPAHTEQAWAQNRRDEFEILNPSVVLRQP